MPLPLFSETQRFRQPWLWTVLLGGAVFYLAATLTGLQQGSGDGSSALLGTVVAGAVTAALLALFWSVRLETRIDDEALRYRLHPLQRSVTTIPWAAVEHAWVREYRPLREYGGWGLRRGRRGGAVNISGSTGLQLVMRNTGVRLLLGTARGPALRTVLQSLEARGILKGAPASGEGSGRERARR